MKRKKIAVMIGSLSDLPQCERGLRYLKDAQNKRKVEVVEVIVNSIHRNTIQTLMNIQRLSDDDIDAIIVGAGWANHLTGVCDTVLRYALNNTKTVVYGVAFEDKENPWHTKAAILSITQVPNTQVVFDDYVGEIGFLKACYDCVESEAPKIKAVKTKPTFSFNIDEAIKRTEEIIRKNEKGG